jgi:transposase
MDVIIGIDPHKSSHTAVALDAAGQVLGELRVTAGTHQVRELQTFAAAWPERRWAVEGANGLGRLLAQQLIASGESVTDVPATLSARVRLLSGGSARKSDSHDARSTAIAALHARQLRSVGVEDVTVVLRMLSDRRDQLAASRNRTVCRLHTHLRHLRPGGAPLHLTADKAGRLLQGIRPDGVVAVQRKQLARELVAELRKIDKQLVDIDARVVEAVTASRTTLTDIVGIGPILAATIIGHAGDIDRFPTRAHFASYAGTAPIEASSGDVSRHRLSRRGNRRLNAAIHMAALSQLSHTSPGRVYVDRRLAEGKSRREAMRALKRQLCNVIYRQLLADAAAHDTAALAAA